MKKFRRQIIYDLRAGTIQYWKQYSVIFLFFLLLHFIFITSYQGENSLSYFDYIWNFVKGIPPFAGADRNQSFSIPMEWAVLHIICMFMNLKYPYIDLYERNIQFFIYSASRRNWWLSKCIWVVMNTVIYYSFFWLGAAVVNFIRQGGASSQVLIEINLWKQVLMLFVLPIFVSIAIGMVAVVFTVFWNPIIGMIVGLGIYIASVYWENSILIGNYSMIIRNYWVKGEGEIHTVKGILFSIIIILFTIAAGSLLIQKKEINRKGKE